MASEETHSPQSSGKATALKEQVRQAPPPPTQQVQHGAHGGVHSTAPVSTGKPGDHPQGPSIRPSAPNWHQTGARTAYQGVPLMRPDPARPSSTAGG